MVTKTLTNYKAKAVIQATGTPARCLGSSLDYSKMTEQQGDEKTVPFSFLNVEIGVNKVS